MATTYATREGRQKILEGLWLIGIEPAQLNVDPGLESQAFLAALHANGVHDEFIGRAIRGVDWRVTDKGPGALLYRIEEWLKTAGYRQDEIDTFRSRAVSQGINNAAGLTRVLAEQFNERTAGAVIHKVTAGKPPAGAVWNPFRTDLPPENVDVKFGATGVLATNLPPGMTSAGPVNRDLPVPGAQRITPGATRDVPTPPASVAKTPANQAPGPPTLSGATPGAPGGPGTGPPGGPPYSPPPVKPLTPQERKDSLQAKYGWAAYLLDDPEVAHIINQVMSGAWSEERGDREWKNSSFYKTTTAVERQWAILERSDPEDARAQLEAQVSAITTKAQGLGLTIDPARARQIAETSKRHGWTDQQVNAALASEIKWDPNGAKTGVLAQIKAAQQEQLVPLADDVMTGWAQSIVSGQRTMEQFQAYLKDQAKSLFPTISADLDRMTVRQYLNPYEQTIKKTLGSEAQVDWSDPKWFRFVNAVDDKGQRHVMSIADMQRTLITDQQYGYDRTEGGKQAKAGLARTILNDWGFLPNTGGAF